MWGVLITLAVSFLLLGTMVGEWALLILGVQAVSNGLYSPLVKPMLNREIRDSSRRATVLSIESIVRRAAFGLFSPVVGFFGAATAIYVCGIFGILGVIALALLAPSSPLRRRIRRDLGTGVGESGPASATVD